MFVRGQRSGKSVVPVLVLLVLIPSIAFSQQEKPKPTPKFLKINGVGAVTDIITVRMKEKNKVYYGRPLGQDSKRLALLRWDGRITTLPKRDRLEVFSGGFAPYTNKELSKRLQKQYGSRYLVQESEHFVVVYPRTKSRKWADQYEAVYRQFRSYMKKRGITIAEPQFPMIVVVLGSRSEFDRALTGQFTFKRNVLGFYSRASNRVSTYVSSDPRVERQVNRFINVTVIHEAIHQIAFNTGFHNRLSVVPRWMSEGFAMLFESPGFRRDSPDKTVADRVNKSRLEMLKKLFGNGRASGKLETMIRNDQLFQTNAEVAYALAWGLSFYLAETQPENYLKFVVQDGNQNQFGDYPPSQRVDLFIKSFKLDLDTLEGRLRNFVKGLP